MAFDILLFKAISHYLCIALQNKSPEIIFIMFKNYLKTAYRSLLKNKIYTLISILGLSVGIVCCLFIAMYVRFESSYDNFFENSDRIYRIALERVYPERVRNFASSPVTIAPTLIDNYPEVEAATRMHRLFFNPEVPVQVGDQSFIETKYFFADSLFFEVFSFQFLEGTPETALDAANKVVLTDKTAARYFGDEPAFGKTFKNGENNYVVSGVIKDLPENSHMDFDLIGSIHDLPFIQNAINTDSWINPWIYTYVKLKEGVDPKVMDSKFPNMVSQYGSANISSRLGKDYASLGHSFNYFLQPLTSIHLHSKLDIEVKPTSNASYLYLLVAIAAFILVLSSINFINLTTARSSERAKEVGVRKVMGSTKRLLVRQFILESIMVCFISFLVSILIALILIKPFNQLIGQSLVLSHWIFSWRLILVVATIIVLGILSGFYPALVISAVPPAIVLKGSYKSSRKGILLRNGLIVLQFFITITMISGTLFVAKQMQYLADKDLGFNKDKVIIVRQAQAIGQNFEAFKAKLEQLADVEAVGGTNAMPGDFMGSNIFRPRRPDISDLRANVATYDDDFISTMDFKVVEGRAFGEAYNDSLAVIINQAAVQELALENPIGEIIKGTAGGNAVPDFRIVGVVEDFSFTSLHTEISPLVIFKGPQNFTPVSIAIRSRTDQFSAINAQIESAWNEFVPNQKIRLSFLDQELNTLYEADQTTAQVFQIFTFIAIIIAFIGLFSLATYVLQLRTKEICVRKILGASFGSIFILLSKNFFQLVLLALALSIPLSYFVTTRWLERFAYHIQLDGWTYALSGGIALLLVLLAIGYQAIKISVVNPAKSLRNE